MAVQFSSGGPAVLRREPCSLAGPCWPAPRTSVTAHSLRPAPPCSITPWPHRVLVPMLPARLRYRRLPSACPPLQIWSVPNRSLSRVRCFIRRSDKYAGTARCIWTPRLSPAGSRRPRRDCGIPLHRKLTQLRLARSPRSVPCWILPRRGWAGLLRWVRCCHRPTSAKSGSGIRVGREIRVVGSRLLSAIM